MVLKALYRSYMLLLPAVFCPVNYEERGCGIWHAKTQVYVLIQGCAGHHKEQTCLLHLECRSAITSNSEVVQQWEN